PASWETKKASRRSRTANRAVWSIRNTRGRAFFAAWPCPIFCSAAITPRLPAGARNNLRPGVVTLPGPRPTKEKPMKNELIALVEESALKKEVPTFDIGDQV